MSQESPRAACRAWATTQLMQPPGLWDSRAASVSVSSALQMASGSSSGSAKMKILQGQQWRGEGKDADPHHPCQGWQEQLTFHFFHCCCGVPLLTLSPHQGQLPGSQNNSGTGGVCPPKSKFSEVLDVTQLHPSRG